MIHKDFTQGTQYTIILFLCLMFVGCQTTAKVQSSKESKAEVQEALSSVTEALSGKKISEEEFRNLEKQIQTDEEVQSAVQAISESVGGKTQIVKYCPVTGTRYAAHIQICPEHQVQLEIVGQ